MIGALAFAAVAAAATPRVDVGAPVPPSFATAQLVDPDGATRVLGDAWRDRPAVLLFLRHYG